MDLSHASADFTFRMPPAVENPSPDESGKAGAATEGAFENNLRNVDSVEPAADPESLELPGGEELSFDPNDVPRTMEGIMTYLDERIRLGKMSREELLSLQVRVQDLSFKIETASKVAEHGMQGTKTALQTQA